MRRSGTAAWSLGLAALAAASALSPAAATAAPRAASIEARLQRVEDRLAIEQLLADYMKAMDAGDWTAYGQLFASNGELMFQKYRYTGPAAITAGMSTPPSRAPDAPRLPPTSERLRHMIGDIGIEVDGDRATDHVRWIVMSKGPDGRPILGATGYYSDTMVRENGRWRFLKRVIYTDFPFDDPIADQRK